MESLSSNINKAYCDSVIINGKSIEKETTTKLLTLFLVKSGSSLSLVENENFLNFLNYIAPWYKPPTRKTVATKVEALYNDGVKAVSEELQLCKKLSLTFDLATLKNSTRHFLVVSCHTTGHSDTELKSLTLQVSEMENRSTSADISNKLKEILQLYKIDKDKVLAVSTDGALNCINSVNEVFGEGYHTPCVNHKLNLVIVSSKKACLGLDHLIEKVKDTVTMFRSSPVMSNGLKAAQLNAGIPRNSCLSLIQDVSTRWNSTFYCIRRYLKLKPFIDDVLQQTRATIRTRQNSNIPDPLEAEDIDCLKEIVSLLEPLEELTRKLSGDKYATISLALEDLTSSHKCLTQLEISTTIAINLRNELTKRIGAEICELRKNLTFSCATLLDPRIKGEALPGNIKQEALSKIKEETKKKITNCYEPPQAVIKMNSGEMEKKFPTLSKLKRKLAEKRGQNQVTHDMDEVERFLQSEKISKTDDPIKYWQVNKDIYPHLCGVALAYLQHPASSVKSERIVSAIKFIVNDRRSRMTSAHINQRVVLRAFSQNICKTIV